MCLPACQVSCWMRSVQARRFPPTHFRMWRGVQQWYRPLKEAQQDRYDPNQLHLQHNHFFYMFCFIFDLDLLCILMLQLILQCILLFLSLTGGPNRYNSSTAHLWWLVFTCYLEKQKKEGFFYCAFSERGF